jgi:hypothetical protein
MAESRFFTSSLRGSPYIEVNRGFELRLAQRRGSMTTVPSQRPARPLGSYEFGTLVLVGLFMAPLVLHLLASVAL